MIVKIAIIRGVLRNIDYHSLQGTDQVTADIPQGYSRGELVDQLGVQPDTLRKALKDGRRRETRQPEIATTKSA
jgi:hypothetical protein